MKTISKARRPKVSKSSSVKPIAASVNAEAAKRLANRFILENLPDRFCAGMPRLLQFPLRSVWAVPVMLSYPRIGPVGQTGIVAVDVETGSVTGWTPLTEMKSAAKAIYEEKKAEIKAAFL